MSRPLRVGVIGCGAIAQMMHLPTLAERPDLFEIAGLADIDRPTLDAVGARYRVERRTTDFLELTRAPEVDALLVLASGSHKRFALAALHAGKHLFVEKPLGFSTAEVEEIACAAERSQARLMVGYHKRFDPAYVRASEEVRRLDGLRYVDVTVLHPDETPYRTHHALLPHRPPAQLSEDEMYRRGLRDANTEEMRPLLDATIGPDAPVAVRMALFVLLTSLIHDINAVRGILGEPARVVSADIWRGGMAQTSVTEFGGDVRVVLNWIFAPHLAHYQEQLRFVGAGGRVTLSFPSPYLRHAPTPLVVERMDEGTHVVEQHTVSYEEAFRAELHAFRDAVLAGRQPSPGLDDARGDLRWIEAIARAF